MSDLNVILADHQGLGRVRLCECNTIHLSLGPVTVTLSLDAFLQATTLLNTARAQMAEIATERSAAKSLFPNHASLLTH